MLDLFSGIGGFSLGLERAGFRTVAFCEIEPYCRAVLRKHWPHVPCHPDITKLDGTEYMGSIDLVCGGFPCQPHSVAGKRKRKSDDRFLWPEMLRIIRGVQPAYVLAENVPAIDDETDMVLDQICDDLEGAGYEVAPPFEIPAGAVGSPHYRYRTWIVAHSNTERCRAKKKEQIFAGRPTTELHSWWSVEPDVDRVAYGLPSQLERGQGIGNAIVPQIAEIIGQGIMRYEAVAG